MTRTLKILVASAAATIALAAPASASYYGTPFKVTVQGQITESWSHTIPGCNGPQQRSGNATINFATPSPQLATLQAYQGWHGTIQTNVSVQRSAVDTEADPICARDNTGCGATSYRALLKFPNHVNKFRLQLAGDSRRWGGRCHTADDPFGSFADQFDSTAYLLGNYGPSFDSLKTLISSQLAPKKKHGKSKKKKPLKPVTITYDRHVDIPYKPLVAGQAPGAFGADIHYTVTFVQAGKGRA